MAEPVDGTLQFYSNKYGGVDEAFWAAMTGEMGKVEAEYFDMKFFTAGRCCRAVIAGLRDRYGSALNAVNMYRAGKITDAGVLAVIEKFALYPNGPYHIIL